MLGISMPNIRAARRNFLVPFKFPQEPLQPWVMRVTVCNHDQ